MDVTDAESVKNAAAQLKDAALDVLINCAGIAGAPGQKTGNIDYESWAQVLDVNTLGPSRVLESFSDHIARSEQKLVITITSGMGSLADNNSGGSIAYRSSKVAVNMVMRSAAIDLAPPGITCILVNPGWVRTDMGGPKAPLSPQESVAAMRRLIETLGPDQSGKFLQLRRLRISVVKGTRRSLKPQIRVVPDSPWMRTGLYQQSNLSPRCRTGNWKKASRDGRPKHAPKGLELQKLPARDWGVPT
jgi:NAD(P)-dependent dehydrogenase (short-subunit alcohol dehydrogenase family)